MSTQGKESSCQISSTSLLAGTALHSHRYKFHFRLSPFLCSFSRVGFFENDCVRAFLALHRSCCTLCAPIVGSQGSARWAGCSGRCKRVLKESMHWAGELKWRSRDRRWKDWTPALVSREFLVLPMVSCALAFSVNLFTGDLCFLLTSKIFLLCFFFFIF